MTGSSSISSPPRPRSSRRGAAALRRARIAALATGVTVYLLIALTGTGETLFRQLSDRYQRWAPRDLSRSSVVLVGIDPESLATIGGWPWSRLYLERLIARLEQSGARAIGLDILLHEPDPISPDRVARLYPELPAATAAALLRLPSPDATLARTIGMASHTAIVLARVGVDPESIDAETATRAPSPEDGAPAALPKGVASYRYVLENLPELDFVASGHGLVNGAPDADGVVRRLPLVAHAGGVPANGLALELARLALGASGIAPIVRDGSLRGVAVADRRVPADGRGQMQLRFGHWPGANLRSAADVMRRGSQAGVFRDRLVIIGLRAAAVGDVVTTPLSEREFGMVVEGQALDAILRGGWLLRPAWAWAAEAALLAVLLGIVTGALPRLGGAGIAAASAGTVALPIAASFALFALAGLLVNPLGALIAALAAGLALAAPLFADAVQARSRLREALVTERVAAARATGEIEAARAIQRGMLPSPAALAALEPAVEVAAILEPARSVGGDFYDALALDDGRVGFLLGDVAGKGVPAALFMALSKAHAHGALLRERGDPGAALAALEAELRDNGEETQLTLVAGVLDVATGEALFCNAGHENPLRIAADGTIEELRLDGGPPLCAVDGFPYPAEPVTLRPGDAVLLLSDGASEAQDDAGRLFGAATVRAALAGGGDPAALVARLVAAVRAHEAGAEPSDDLTCLALRWQPRPPRSG